MKKLYSLFITVVLFFAMTLSAAAQETEHWMCLICGIENTEHFCGKCGHEEGSWICPVCHTINTGEICTECAAVKGDILYADEAGNLFFRKTGTGSRGEGIMIRPDGILYEGKWENGLPAGIGIKIGRAHV